MKPKTIKQCQSEIERVLRIYLYSKIDKSEEENFKNQLRSLFEAKGAIEHTKLQEAEERRARRERIKYLGKKEIENGR